MSRSDELRLEDIREACRTLADLADRGKGAFDADPAVRLAMERLLEIIGEAATALDEETTATYPDVQWRDVTRLRILLAHHYHRVDPSQVWTIVTSDIPTLLNKLSAGEDPTTTRDEQSEANDRGQRAGSGKVVGSEDG